MSIYIPQHTLYDQNAEAKTSSRLNGYACILISDFQYGFSRTKKLPSKTDRVTLTIKISRDKKPLLMFQLRMGP